MRSLSLWAVAAYSTAAFVMGGCENDLGEVRGPVGDDPPLADWSDAAPPHTPPVDDDDPTITIETAELDEAGGVALTGTADDDRGVAAIRIAVGASGPYDIAPIGRGFAAWRATVPAPAAGPIALRATAYDGAGNTAIAEALIERPMPDDVTPPTVTIAEPIDGLETNVARLFVSGTAEDDSAIAEVTIALRVDGDEMPLGPALTGDFFAHWSLGAPLPPATTVEYVVRATDIAGNSSEAIARVTSRAAPPHAPPRVVASTPADGAEVDTLLTPFEFTLEADAAIVHVAAGRVGGPLIEATADPARAGAYTVDLWLQPGDNPLRVISRDAAGLVGRDVLRVTHDDGYGPLVPVELVSPGLPGGPVDVELDRAGVVEMFPDEIQPDLVLMDLDPHDLVGNALDIIRASCGPGWEGPHFVNGAFLFDCPDDWGPAELNLWGLLTMTGSNVDVSGTSLNALPGLVEDNFDPSITFGGLLSQALDLPDDVTPLLDNAPMTQAIVEALIASHPETTPGGKMPVSLFDGLENMRPLAEKFGAQPGDPHPGFIDGYVEATVLGPDFRMILTMTSNLTLYEGVDLEAVDAATNAPRPGKRIFADRNPALPVIGLNFINLQDFDLQGIVDNPEVAMNFRMVESDLAATPGRRLGADGDGSMPDGQGNSDVWGPSFEPWELEYVVALASRHAFGGLRSDCNHCSDPEMLWLSGWDLPPCPLLPNRQYDEQTCDVYDFAEIAIGATGYDCAADEPCTNFQDRPGEVNPTPVGVTEHMSRLVEDDCDGNDNICRTLFGPSFRCDDFGICFDRDAPDVCFVDGMCPAGEFCVGGACRAEAPECVTDLDCESNADACYYGYCVEVPAGWFRMWAVAGLPVEPAYMWDVVLEVAQARMRDGVDEGEGDVVFQLEGVPTGLRAADIVQQVRNKLHAQAAWLSNALLGSYAEGNPDVDLYLDDLGGETWLMLNPCRTGTAYPAPCNAPGAGLFDADGNQLDRAAPNGLPGVPHTDLSPGMALFYQGQPGTARRRIDVRALTVDGDGRDRLHLWLRQ